MDQLAQVVPALERWARQNSGAHYDKDDLVSDVIIHFLQNPGRWDKSRGSLRKFLFSCMRNRSCDAHKAYHRKGREKLRNYLRHEVQLYTLPQVGCDSTFDLKEHIDKLPPKLAEPLRLLVYDGKKHQEIAECLGIRKEYVRSLLHRARAKLRKVLASA